MSFAKDTRFLIVDDEEAIRNGMKQALEARGLLFVDCAEGVDEALAMLASGSYDCIISDYSMGVRSGIELLIEVRRNARLAKIPFALVSARMNVSLEERGLALGATICQTKMNGLSPIISALEEKLTL
jgi:CheY-like chemotaxis protein